MSDSRAGRVDADGGADATVNARSQKGNIPDLKWVNRHVPIRDVCAALELHFDSSGMIHCWHPERHKNGDRTPSASIRKSTNRVRCFGCGSKTLSVVDLVMDVQSTLLAGAVGWLQRHFELKYIAKGQHLKDAQAIRPYMVGHEQPIELLVKSGIWANLNAPTQRIVPVLLSFAKRSQKPETFQVQISYRAIQRYSGVRSFETISAALQQLREMEWLEIVPQAKREATVLQDVNIYLLTPYSDAVMELANATAAAARETIEQERELRKQQREVRRHATETTVRSSAKTATQSADRSLLQSTSLYAQRSVEQDCATPIVTGNRTKGQFSGLGARKVVFPPRRRTGVCGHVRRHDRGVRTK